MDIIIASNNRGKIDEIKLVLGEKFKNLYSLSDKNIDIEVEETGTTFKENAFLKAKAITDLYGVAALADDSGLCVDALKGEPGVYSARYAGYPCNDQNNNNKLLKALKDAFDRTAHFVSVVCLTLPDGRVFYGEGKTSGYILKQGKGTMGFGYDPLFFAEEINMTFAEATLCDKNRCSHRARALNDLMTKLSEVEF